MLIGKVKSAEDCSHSVNAKVFRVNIARAFCIRTEGEQLMLLRNVARIKFSSTRLIARGNPLYDD